MSSQLLTASNFSIGITASDLQKSLRFYTVGLGFEISNQHESDGAVRFYSLKAGEAEIGIGQDDFAKGKDRVKGVGLRLWITTAQDLGLIAGRVKTAGFKVDSEPAPLPWGQIAFTVTDPDGIKLTISNGG